MTEIVKHPDIQKLQSKISLLENELGQKDQEIRQMDINSYDEVKRLLSETRKAHRMYGIALCEMFKGIDNLFREKGLNIPERDYDYKGIIITQLADNFDKGEYNADQGTNCRVCGGPLSPPDACTCGPECHNQFCSGKEGSLNKDGHQLKAGLPPRPNHNKG